MSMTEMDIAPGFETQVAVTPILYGTTKAAQTRFSPEERGCYFDHELPLKYLPSKWYRYDINNCLFEAAYEKGNYSYHFKMIENELIPSKYHPKYLHVMKY